MPRRVKGQRTGDDVTTGGGKGRNQYGKRFGKKHTNAMMQFTKTLWMQDAEASLRKLLQNPTAQQAMMEFLKTEYGEAQLEFYLAANAAVQSGNSQQGMTVFNQFLALGGQGIGQQERTGQTQQVWDMVNQGGGAAPGEADPNTVLQKLKEEADNTIKMMAFDAFPRFLRSKYCGAVMQQLKQSGSQDAGQIEAALNQSGAKMPQDADDWLNMFVSAAESFPACIVISDMTIPGAPMVYVNGEFSRTTGYTREESVGRNCRFLQGPDTEPESIQVIRNTLS
eukprot:CAMPEP_0118886926 /NCGR_PEP_ID=MMETSP1163-20130328/24838_1 /TAXON_ID=124430 /ORGANISM="Phaeomonas parva, Strain CCMP2877" /LENGTH=280 /DNA_ID=CAMNT_0006825257 /DNA_START=21 /DNA_END=859 /DNA_ORIENTATION=-